MKKKYLNELITKAHKLSVWQSNKEVAKALKLTDRQLRYVLYKLKPQEIIPEREKTLVVSKQAERKVTITESLLNFFGGGD